jgi:DNA invertase Pin-like site-specific DNA recombinase
MNTVLDHAQPTAATPDDMFRQLAYAYMRVPCNIPDDKVRRMEHELHRFAERRGLRLVETFYEFTCGSHEAFNDLIAELQRTGSVTVIVPTLRHLARSVMLQNCLLSRLEFDAQADVYELVETP